MTETISCDTNILIYAVDASEGSKHLVAKYIVDTLARQGAPLPLQALNEFFFVCIRKKKLPLHEAESYVRGLTRSMKVIRPSSEDLLSAVQLHRQYGQQFYDALLVSTANRAGCTVFFSEDAQHTSRFEEMRFLNPFLLTPAELDALLA